jgi:DNA-binding CsgD family transcriptional regulator
MLQNLDRRPATASARRSGVWGGVSGRAAECTDVVAAVVSTPHGTADRTLLAEASSRVAASETELLEVLSDPSSGPEVLDAACSLLAVVLDAQADLRGFELRLRFRALERVHDAVDRLRRATTVRQLVDQVPRELCAAGSFDRSMLSHLRGSTWVPRRMHFDDDERHPTNLAFRDYSLQAEIALTSTMPEAELVHRRTPTLIRDRESLRRVAQPMLDVSQCSGYVAAPLITSTGVIGFLHADAFSSGRDLEPEDRDNVRAFADGLALVFERAVAEQRVEVQRRSVREAFTQAERRVRALREPTVAFPAPTPDDGPDAAVTTTAGPPEVASLTDREREIVDCLAAGASNRQVAAELVIAESTVKSHVKNVMRKLGANTRSGVVSLYLQQTIVQQGRPRA